MKLPVVLEPPDSFHVDAAEGWLLLGCPGESLIELRKISGGNRQHPSVLEAQWNVLAHQQDWGAALEVARVLLQADPASAESWLHHAYSLRRAPGGGTERAREALLPAMKKFPEVPVIPYNLACYAALLGKADEAVDLLGKAFKVSENPGEIRRMALADPDLETLWPQIRKMPV